MDFAAFFADRVRRVDASGIRKWSNLAAKFPGAVNLTLGQPEFPVPAPIKHAAVDAILADKNGYSGNPGINPLLDAIADRLKGELGWTCLTPGRNDGKTSIIVVGGTTAAITMAALACLNEGDACIIPDPYFVLYPHAIKLAGGVPVKCDTAPRGFRMTAQDVEPLLDKHPRTKMLIYNSPSNPAGVVGTERDVADLLDLCRRRNVLLVADEIYDEMTFPSFCTQRSADGTRSICPSPARLPDAMNNVMLVRGFGKTYGVTGWRLGYIAAAGPLIEQFIKLQQYLYVNAPTPLQHAMTTALRTDMSAQLAVYQKRAHRCTERLRSAGFEVQPPGGAFYAFPKVPPRSRFTTATELAEHLATKGVFVVPAAGVFTAPERDTHFRISYAVDDTSLDRGLDAITAAVSA